MSEHAAYIAGLRELADQLESTPKIPTPVDQRLQLPLSTNAAVVEFAAGLELEVSYDEEGNASASLWFGPLELHAYGYVDFAEHCAAFEERRARKWAAENGLTIESTPGGAS